MTLYHNNWFKLGVSRHSQRFLPYSPWFLWTDWWVIWHRTTKWHGAYAQSSQGQGNHHHQNSFRCSTLSCSFATDWCNICRAILFLKSGTPFSITLYIVLPVEFLWSLFFISCFEKSLLQFSEERIQLQFYEEMIFSLMNPYFICTKEETF